jgi:hypothetical protein
MMRTMRRTVTVSLLALGLGCAPALQGTARIHPRGGDGAPPAASVDLGAGDEREVMARAATVLLERGLRIATCEPARIVTAPRELDVPCGTSTCLARELVVVRVAEHSAQVEILRGVWEPAARGWVMALTRSTADDAARREAELLGAILAPGTRGGPVAAACAPRAAAISLAPR